MRNFIASLLVTGLVAHSPPARGADQTTLDVVRCADAVDQGICLLKIHANEIPASERFEFAYAPDIAKQIDAGIAPHKPVSDAYEAAVTKPLRDARRLAVEAIAADRRGASPAEALKPIEPLGQGLSSRPFIAGQIITPSGGDFRGLAYSYIWNAFETASKNPKAPAPSKALLQAALSRWESELEKATPVRGPGFESLAPAYIALGDEAGLARVERRDRGAVFAARFNAASERNDINEMARLVATWPSDQRNRHYYEARRKVLKSDRPARADLVRAIVDVATKDEPSVAIGALIKADKAAGLTVTEQLDRRGRNVADPAAAYSAADAARGWLALGQRDRANALLALWIPRAQAEANKSCGPCVAPPVMQMLGDADRTEEGWAIGIARMTNVIEMNIAEGRGVSRIEKYLDLEKVEFEREYGLKQCVRINAGLNRMSDAETCMRLMVDRVGYRPLSEHEVKTNAMGRHSGSPIGGPYTTFATALSLASAHARKGDVQSTQRWLKEAVQIARKAPEENLDVGTTFDIDQIGLALLRAQGRL